MNKMNKTDWSQLETCRCNECGIKIIHRKNEKYSEYKNRKFCTNKCKMSSLSKLFIGKKAHNNKQKERICKICGKKQMVAPSLSDRPFCSRKCMAKWLSEKQKGQNHWNWQGGITEKPSRDMLYDGYSEWRKTVFQRDGYTCVLCGENKSGQLQAHHIKPRASYKELILDVSNGLTVCKKCHKEIHYGKNI